MAFGPEVGQVSVRVNPDTRGFRAEANRQLKAIKDQLKELKVKLVVDDRLLKKTTKEYSKKLPKELPAPKIPAPKLELDDFQKKALKDLKALSKKLEAKIPLTPEGEAYRRRMEEELRKTATRIKQKVPVEMDLAASARRQIKMDVDRLTKQIDPKPIRINVDTNNRLAVRQLNQLRRDIPRLIEQGNTNIEINVDEKRAKGRLRALIAELKAEAALAGITIDVDIDVPVLKTGAVGAAKGLGGLGSVIQGQWVAIGALIAAVVAPALALLSGLLATLPGLLATLVTPIAAIALGMDGLKKAAERLKPAFEKLKKTMSSAFEKAFTPLADQLDKSGIFTVLNERLPLIANGLASMAKGFVDSVTSAAGLNKIDQIIGDISAGLFQAGPGIRSFSDALLGLTAGFTKHFPGMAQWFNDVGNSFSNWVKDFTKADESGTSKMDRTLQSLSGVLKELGGLGLDLLKKGFEWASDPKFGQAMKDFVADVRYLVNEALPAMKTIFESIAGTINSMTKDMKGIQETLDGLSLKNLTGQDGDKDPGSTFMKALQPSNFIGPLKNLNQLRMSLDLIRTAFNLLPDSVTNFVYAVGSAIPTVIGEVQSRIGSLFGAVGAIISTTLSTIWQSLQTLPQTIMTAFTTLPALIGAVFQSIPSTLSAVFTAIPTLIGGAFSSLVGTVQSHVGNVVSTVASAFAQLPGLVAGGIGAMISTVADGMAQVVSAIATGVGNAIAEVGRLGSELVAKAREGISGMTQAGVDLIMGLVGGLGKAIGSAVAKAREVASSIVSAVKGIFNSNSPSKVFMGIGNDVVDGLTIGIGDKQNAAVGQATGLAQGVVDSARKVIAEGIDPLMVDVQLDPAALANLKKERDLLELQADTLRVQKDQAPDKMAKAALQAQLDQINARKREIALIQEQAQYQKKYGEEVASTQADYSSQINDMAKIPFDFAQAGAKQFMSDIGISGNGALPAIAQWGMDLGSKFVFNVGNMDQALSAQQTLQRKEAAVRY